MLTVCSFYVDRRADYPAAIDYLSLLHALDRSCARLSIPHVVLTDVQTGAAVRSSGLVPFEMELPRNLMRALTEAQACWLEKAPLFDTLFVGADCLVAKDPRGHLPDEADLSIILRPGHKRHRINNGFMYIPVASRKKVTPLFREIADVCGEVMCDDMVAVERALAPMPTEYGLCERSGINVNFLPMDIWNGGPKSLADPAADSFVLHFRGSVRKKIMVDWAALWLSQ